MEVQENPVVEEIPTPKKSRKRFKKLFQQIQRQMEFYFSDANLNKDRFMTKLVADSESGMIDLDVFMKFNRIKSLCSDKDMLAKALKKSKMLVVSDNGRFVQRKIPFTHQSQSDIDDRTIYVESLPPNADHEVLKKVFSTYGNVLFVSLPRYKTSRELKNFAFIEFEKKEEADKAVLAMGSNHVPDKAGRFPKMHNKQWQSLQKQASESKMDAEETEGVKPGRKRPRNTSGDTIEGEDGSNAQKKRNLGTEPQKSSGVAGKEGKKESNETTKADASETEIQKKGGKDRRRSKEKIQKKSDLESDSDNQKDKQKAKRIKLSSDSESKTEVPEGTQEKLESKPKVPEGAEEKPEKLPMKGILKQESHENVLKSKKRRLEEGGSDSDAKRVKIEEDPVTHSITIKKKKRRHPSQSQRRQEKGPSLAMKVLSKKQWLELKKEYLTLQKESMKNLKKTVRDKRRKPSKSVEQEEESIKPARTIEYTPNVIIHIRVDPLKMPMSRQQIKEKLNPDAIAYVDMNDGDQVGHIRCKSEDSAKEIIGSSTDSFKVKLIEGEEEKQYWEKIMLDRQHKLNGKRKKKRGAQKVMEKVDRIVADPGKKKHVFFDDE